MRQNHSIDISSTRISPDVDEFSSAIRDHGIVLVHYKSMRCPIGVVDRYDSRNDHSSHDDCSNGFMYEKAGEVTALFTNNQFNTTIQDLGNVDMGTVMVTFPRFYDSTDGKETPVIVLPYDRFYLKDFDSYVANWQLVDSNLKGFDRLQYPATQIEFVVDSEGTRYKQDVHFVLQDGGIRWLDKGRPPFNPKTGQSAVYSARYLYQPFYYCKNLVHEVRVVRSDDAYSGERKLTRMPYAAILQREIVFENEYRRSEKEKFDARDVKEPPNGSFGAG